jgi:hypothetical protein
LELYDGNSGHAITRASDSGFALSFWGLAGTGSTAGAIRYNGGDVRSTALATPAKLTPEDSRPDSAGKGAGEGVRDVGADVDLVGLGAAYERWTKTPACQQWRKDTQQPP